jgi:MFS family permease
LVTVYLVVATVATLALGRLGDLHGRRRVLLLGMAVFAAGSVGAALAPSMPVLIIFRAVQGVGGAVYPLTLSLARDRVPQERTTVVIAGLTAAFGVGTALGFLSGGLLAEYLSWRAIFWLGAVLVAGGALAVRLQVRESDERAEGAFDWLGTLTMGLAAVSLLVALTLVVSQGVGSPATLALLAGAAVFGGAWVLVERRVENPLVDLHILGNRPVLVGNLATIGLGWALFSSFLLVPELARARPAVHGYGLGADSATVGFLLLPLAAGQMVSASAAGVLARRVPSRLVYAAGLLLLTAGTGGLAVDRTGAWLTAGLLLALGLGAGAALQSASAVSTEGVAADVAAASASLNSTVRRLAGGIGGQISTLIVAALTVSGAPRFAAFTISYALASALCLGGAALALLGEGLPGRRAS